MSRQQLRRTAHTGQWIFYFVREATQRCRQPQIGRGFLHTRQRMHFEQHAGTDRPEAEIGTKLMPRMHAEQTIAQSQQALFVHRALRGLGEEFGIRTQYQQRRAEVTHAGQTERLDQRRIQIHQTQIRIEQSNTCRELRNFRFNAHGEWRRWQIGRVSRHCTSLVHRVVEAVEKSL
jgi:hypothetical protein